MHARWLLILPSAYHLLSTLFIPPSLAMQHLSRSSCGNDEVSEDAPRRRLVVGVEHLAILQHQRVIAVVAGSPVGVWRERAIGGQYRSATIFCAHEVSAGAESIGAGDENVAIVETGQTYSRGVRGQHFEGVVACRTHDLPRQIALKI